LDVLVGGEFVAITNRVEAARLYPGLEDAMRFSRIEALSVEPLRSGPLTLGVLICWYGRKRVFAESVRELLNQTLETVFEAATRRLNTMAVIFFDLDGFKVVNDRLGHAAGDSVPIEVAQRLRNAVRDVDTVARFGGDEFVVVCTDVDPGTAQGLAERIRLAVQHPLTGAAVGFRVTASVGLVVCHPDAGSELTTASILRMADSAMYTSKRSGKDRVTTLHAGESVDP
jgi:diguanylate cyclase (GGDEF)-like protein